ncbi:response regulator transcription factor [Methylobacterium nodulans]|uniref:Two component transcriptional regulator, LuxR family n=1 Tax=Methylobacterium nodulans (strain LMG 21967 / CNCM I-2342 / ORS 2060) TaxID=460265 RepID=B8IWY0_METNO|nr:response regulator transcription factor [Methylobacterium nodulans]ACL63021.1 two component transcriptional regulator, LuxR family [Methylobacterium nodulans ORS 2060]
MSGSVLIIDDHPVVLQGCRVVLEDAGLATIHVATGVEEGYQSFYRNRPGLVVADLTFQDSGLTGLSLIRRIRALEPATRILVFSMHDDPVIVARALEGGAIGYLLKDTPSVDFATAVARVQAGEPYIDHRLAMKVAILQSSQRVSPLLALTGRELQIFLLLSRGKSYEMIAKYLSLSYKTVANTCSSMRRKLGAESLSELIRLAIRHHSQS